MVENECDLRYSKNGCDTNNNFNGTSEAYSQDVTLTTIAYKDSSDLVRDKRYRRGKKCASLIGNTSGQSGHIFGHTKDEVFGSPKTPRKQATKRQSEYF